MTRRATGRIIPVPDGKNLVLERTFRAPIEDVWASITEPERSARWIGCWSGEPGVGRTILLRMSAEDGAKSEPVAITACDPPRLLALDWAVEESTWKIEVTLAERDGTTTLTFVQHLAPDEAASDIGPGWEYYLDRLIAAHEGEPFAAWDDYYPAQKDHYAAATE